MNLKETELCLGLPGGGVEKVSGGKRGFEETVVEMKLSLEVVPNDDDVDLNKKKKMMMDATTIKEKNLFKDDVKPPAKAQVVGWPPVRSYRKNIMTQKTATAEVAEKSGSNNASGGAAFVKVSMDGAPYLRKLDLKMYKTYRELSDALAKMFSSFTMGTYV